MDFTGAQMILTLKVIAAAVCYQDGLLPAEQLRAYAAEKRLHRLPSLLEYCSYVFASGNLLAGPFFEAHDYFQYIERQGIWAPDAARPMPSPLVPGLLRFGKALVAMAVYVGLGWYSPSVLESAWYSNLSLPRK